MLELEKPGFDTAAFLASAGLGRRIVQLAPMRPFLRKEARRIPSSTFKKAAQRSRLFPQPGRKPPSRFSLPVTLLEKRRSRQWLDRVWPRSLPLPPAPRSK